MAVGGLRAAAGGPPMKLTTDEHRALTFIAALLCLSAAVRFVGLPEPVAVPEGGVELAGQIEAVEAAVAEREAMTRPLADGERVDPNTAPVAELARLPRVGPALAARIVADRESNGSFRTLGDLGRVPGVGDRTLELLAPHVALRPGPTASDGGTMRAGALDLNRATVAELQRLPGVGPVLAARIVAYRDSVGGFRGVDDLVAVKGIGSATLARFRGRIVVR